MSWRHTAFFMVFSRLCAIDIEEKNTMEPFLSASITHTVNVRNPYFSQIQEGIKTWEGRLRKERFRQIKKTDFINFKQEDRNCLCQITSICPFATFEEMLSGTNEQGIPYYKLFIPNADNLKEAEEIYLGLPGYKEGEALYGVVGFQLKLWTTENLPGVSHTKNLHNTLVAGTKRKVTKQKTPLKKRVWSTDVAKAPSGHKRNNR